MVNINLLIVILCYISVASGYNFILGLFGIGVSVRHVTYYLYTKSNPDEGIRVIRKYPDIIAEDKNAITVFIVHGWLENKEEEWYKDLKDAYLSKNDTKYQVVEVDWSSPAKQIYPISQSNTKEAGEHLGYFIVELSTLYGMSLKNFEITGHSLGGHLAGFAGKKVFDMTGEKIRRITAMDPAGPLFNGNAAADRLCEDDADVVVAIHTDNFVGFTDRCGSIDFYPNGGYSMQPGCMEWSMSTFSCSHWRSFKYFEEALRTNQMVGTKCSNYILYCWGFCQNNMKVHLGGEIFPNQTGKFYFKTNSEPPFTIIENDKQQQLQNTSHNETKMYIA